MDDCQLNLMLKLEKFNKNRTRRDVTGPTRIDLSLAFKCQNFSYKLSSIQTSLVNQSNYFLFTFLNMFIFLLLTLSLLFGNLFVILLLT